MVDNLNVAKRNLNDHRPPGFECPRGFVNAAQVSVGACWFDEGGRRRMCEFRRSCPLLVANGETRQRHPTSAYVRSTMVRGHF